MSPITNHLEKNWMFFLVVYVAVTLVVGPVVIEETYLIPKFYLGQILISVLMTLMVLVSAGVEKLMPVRGHLD